MYIRMLIQEAGYSQSLGEKRWWIPLGTDMWGRGGRGEQKGGGGEAERRCRPTDTDPVGSSAIRIATRVVSGWVRMGRFYPLALVMALNCEPPGRGVALVCAVVFCSWLTAGGSADCMHRCKLQVLQWRIPSFSSSDSVHLFIHPPIHLSMYQSVYRVDMYLCNSRNSNVAISTVPSIWNNSLERLTVINVWWGIMISMVVTLIFFSHKERTKN